MKRSHLNSLRALEASVRHGSFRAAAEEIGVTAAAVGQHVRTLETYYGYALLHRHANGFVPSDLARKIAGHLKSGFAEVDEATRLLGRGEQSRGIALISVPTFAERWLLPRLPEFLAQHPSVELRVDQIHPCPQSAAEAFDIAITYDAQPGFGGVSHELFHEWLLPVCRPRLCEASDPGDARRLLQVANLLEVDKETDDPLWVDWDGWAHHIGTRIPAENRRLKFRNATLALSSMLAGHGLHLAQLSMVVDELHEGTLVAPFGSGQAIETKYPYRLLGFERGSSDADKRALIDWIRSSATRTETRMRRFLAA